VTVRVINDTTGWTKVIDVPDDYPYYTVRMPFVDDVHGGFGETVFKLSGERDAHGRLIFRTREQ